MGSEACPACGEPVADGRPICPACGTNVDTLRRVAEDQRRLADREAHHEEEQADRAARAAADQAAIRHELETGGYTPVPKLRRPRVERERWGWKWWALIVVVAAIGWSIRQAARDDGDRGGGSGGPPITEADVLDAALPAFGDALAAANAAVGGEAARRSRGPAAGTGTCPWISGRTYRCRFIEDLDAANDLDWPYKLRLDSSVCFTARLDGEPGEGSLAPAYPERFPLMRAFHACAR